jgi:hypothetical protein
MTTAAVQYLVTTTPKTVETLVPAVLDIYYIDKNGATQQLLGYAAPHGQWVLNFTGTVGNAYYCAAKETQSGLVTNVSISDGGSVAATANNSANTNLLAGAEGTI